METFVVACNQFHEITLVKLGSMQLEVSTARLIFNLKKMPENFALLNSEFENHLQIHF